MPFDVPNGLALAFGVLPAAIIGVAPVRRARVRVVLLSTLMGVPIFVGSVLSEEPALAVLAIVVLWGIVAMRLAQPIVLLKVGANMAGIVLVVSSLHLLYINTRLLPPHVRPPMWRRVALVAMAVFYAFFVGLSVIGAYN